MRRRLLPAVFLAVVAFGRVSASDPVGAPPDALRLTVEGDALVHVPWDLVLRLAPAWHGKPLSVTRRGVPVPQVAPKPSDAVSFVAREGARKAGLYELRPASAPVPHVEIVRSGSVVERFTWEEDREHGAVAAEEPSVYDRDIPAWYLARIQPAGAFQLPIEIPKPGPAPGASATLDVGVVGTHEGPVVLRASWGGTDLGSTSIPLSPRVASARFEVAAVPGRPMPLRLLDATGALPPAKPRDVSDDRGAVWIDSVSIAVRTAEHDLPRFREDDGTHRRLREWRVFDGPVAHQAPPDPVEAARSAALAIVTTRALAPAAHRLAAHRSAQGVAAVVVPIAHLRDRFSGGEGEPEAIRRFVAALPNLRYLLLFGDAALDRTDLDKAETIPTALVRTKYNGATASDRWFGVADPRKPAGGPAVGRLPYRALADADAYVDRLIRYETSPPAHPTARLLRFVTGEGRFGAAADMAIELLFGKVVAALPAAYDVEVTFANPRSDYCWPPEEFSAKVASDLNAGSLFYTYVGHGFARGFDHLWAGGRRFPIFEAKDVERVAVEGTPPHVVVVACTTAIFDATAFDGVGELLMRRPNGPVSYWGATRICHPVWNSLVGRRLAMELGRRTERVGDVLRGASDEVIAPTEKDSDRGPIELAMRLFAPGEDFQRLYAEGALMYALLGDPAARVAYPPEDLPVRARATADGVVVDVGPGVEDGAEVRVSVEVSRMWKLGTKEPAGEGIGPVAATVMKRNHARANDKALARGVVKASAGGGSIALAVPDEWRERPLSVKAWTISKGALRVGTAAITLPERPAPAGGEPPKPPR